QRGAQRGACKRGRNGAKARRTESAEVFVKRSKREKPPELNPAADTVDEASSFYRVAALATVALEGRNCQAHLLADGPRQEPAHRMRLPARGLPQFLGGCTARPFQQFEDPGRFAAIP